jgi:hypothetical protein
MTIEEIKEWRKHKRFEDTYGLGCAHAIDILLDEVERLEHNICAEATTLTDLALPQIRDAIRKQVAQECLTTEDKRLAYRSPSLKG